MSGGMAQDDDMSFPDWSAHLDSLSADSNHCWLPAYGLQPPIDQGPAQQQFLFLETIQEETSDDLRSESSRSSHAGWPESDSDAGSVIHIAATYNGEDHHAANGPSSWSGSERDLAVPPKRRRQDDGWGTAGTGVALSRSSSLIAFESLERRLSEEEEALTGPATGMATGMAAFRTTATLRPFDWNESPSASDEDSEDDDQDSDDSLLQSFNSSRGSFRSSAGSERLRSFRSLDSLSLLQSTSGGTVNSGGAAYLSRPCQDLSLSSEGDAAAAACGGGDDVFEPRFCLGRQERSHSLSPKPSLRSLLDATYSLSDHEDMDQHVMDAMDAAMEDMDKHMDHSAAMTRDDFLDGPDDASSAHHSSSSSSSSTSSTSSGNDDVIAMLPVANVVESTPGSGRTQRSAENLSEDSGFGEHAALPTGKRLTVCPILEDDVVDDDSCSSSCYSACSSSSGGGRKKTDEVNLEWGASDAKFSAGWHRSAPDLLVCSLAAVVDAHPLSELPDKHPVVPVGLLAGPPTMASTPDLAGLGAIKQLHDEGLSKALSTGTALAGTATSKGVHFCPVVAEVSWRDSYSDVDDEDVDETDGPRSDPEEDDDDDEDEDHEDEEEAQQGVAYKLQVAGVVADVHRQAKQTTAAAPQPDSASPAAAGPPPRVPPRSPPRAPTVPPPAAPASPTAASQPASPASSAPPHHAQHASSASRTGPQRAQPSVTSMAAPKPQALPPGAGSATTSPATSPTSSPKKTSRFGDFFQRFSLRRLSGRHHDHAKKLTRSKSAPTSPAPGATKQQGTNTQSAPPYEDVRIIPLHPSPEELEAERREEERRRAALATKPPLPPSAPPRVPRGVARPNAGHHGGHAQHHHPREPRDVTTAAAAAAVTAAVATAWRAGGSSSMAGLLETDLDADLPLPPPGARGVGNGAGAKARSLLDVSGVPHAANHHHHHHQLSLHRDASPGGMLSAGSQDNNSRAKSMEFLLDRRNQEAVQPPENALQGLQGRVLSEHELRVQRSLQQLNVPDWYKNSSRPSEGFLLKRGSDATSVAGRRGAGGWPGLGVKTTSLSSLRSPTTAVRLGSSPSPPPAAFTRWSSSRLHSAGSAGSASATPSTSPCGSARSSFNHRQPYLGWRSQERLSGTPRTPAERLAQGLLEQREHQRQQERLRGSSQLQSSSPNLSDVRSSIKEVTSAIVHYVSAANDPGSNTDVRLAGRSPAPSSATTTATGTARDREDHPRSHSNQRVCWIESSFVGSRPLEQPQTPEEGSVSTSPLPMHHQDLYLDLKQRSQRSSTCATGAAGSLPSNGPTTVPGPHQSHASPDEIDMHHDSDSSEHNLKRTPSKRDTAFIRKRNRRALKKKKGSKTWKTKSKLKVVSLELFFGIGVCML